MSKLTADEQRFAEEWNLFTIDEALSLGQDFMAEGEAYVRIPDHSHESAEAYFATAAMCFTIAEKWAEA